MTPQSSEDRRAWRPAGWGGPPPAARPPMRGLGDVVAAVTTAVGIKPCGGCKERQAALNRLVPFAGAETPPAAPEQPEATQSRPDGPDAA